jgi:sigma-B regulation protein RsbU (phosphoserine phosphatase)
VTQRDEVLDASAEELFEEAPCGFVITRPDGAIVRVNRTFEEMTGFDREQLVAGRRLQDLLTPGARIYHETHYAPLLRMQGWVKEIAVELIRSDGTRLAALINSVVGTDHAGDPQVVRTTVFDATDRRRYEQELLRARNREREIAGKLQRSMLAGSLPEDPRLDLAVEYQPAVDSLEIGGDWYDAFWTGERSIGVVVGDVVGRGLEAAAVMGQLRSAVRALASTGLGPGALLNALDRYANQYGVGEMATVAYAQLDLDTGDLRIACAGHPPPAIAEPGRRPSFVLDGRSAPLDVYSTSTTRPQADLVLAQDAVLVLFTDGLVERVDRPIDAGFDRLLIELGGRAGGSVGYLAADLPRIMLADSRTRDDVCVVVLRRLGG